MLDFTSPAIQAAFIALVSAAIVVPLVKRWFFDARIKLVCKIYVADFSMPKSVTKALPPTDSWKFFSASNYARLSITNKSKRIAKGITVQLEHGGRYQIGSSEETVEVPSDGKVTIGDLSPKHTIKVQIWMSYIYTLRSIKDIRRALVVSAEEYDVVKTIIPFNDFQRLRIFDWLFNVILFFGGLYLLLWVAANVWTYLDPAKFK